MIDRQIRNPAPSLDGSPARCHRTPSVEEPPNADHQPTRRGRIFIDPAAYTDVDRWHAVAAELRAEGPLHRVELADREPFWVVLGLPEVMEVEKHSEVFTNAPAPVLTAKPVPRDQPNESPVNTLIQMDGEEHRAHRALVNEWFKPGEIKKLSDQVAAPGQALDRRDGGQGRLGATSPSTSP